MVPQKKYFILHIAVEVENLEADCGCDETSDLMVLARKLELACVRYPSGIGARVKKAFLLRDYVDLPTKEQFDDLWKESMDKRGI